MGYFSRQSHGSHVRGHIIVHVTPVVAKSDVSVLVASGTSADDLYPLFDRYGKVVDIFIPRDRRQYPKLRFVFVDINCLLYGMHLMLRNMIRKRDGSERRYLVRHVTPNVE